jgi:hypothetical protein
LLGYPLHASHYMCGIHFNIILAPAHGVFKCYFLFPDKLFFFCQFLSLLRGRTDSYIWVLCVCSWGVISWLTHVNFMCNMVFTRSHCEPSSSCGGMAPLFRNTQHFKNERLAPCFDPFTVGEWSRGTHSFVVRAYRIVEGEISVVAMNCDTMIT